jgi:hypothetical protein
MTMLSIVMPAYNEGGHIDLVKWARVRRRCMGEIVALRAAERSMRGQGLRPAALRRPGSAPD